MIDDSGAWGATKEGDDSKNYKLVQRRDIFMAKILIIDDNEELRDLIEIYLTEDNHNVTLAKDGEEGLSIFNSYPFDLIITDIVMPNKCGIDFIVELDNAANKTPIIAMSGGGRTQRLTAEFNLDSAVSLGGGVKATLKKPFTQIELREAIRKSLR